MKLSKTIMNLLKREKLTMQSEEFEIIGQHVSYYRH